jgi:DNA-binding response OmpR family regulator
MESKLVVVVEDDPALREIVTHKLITNGFDVKMAEDGKAGLELIKKEKPKIVLLDLNGRFYSFGKY